MEPTLEKTSTISILYVEDDQDARNLLLSMLVTKYPEQRFYIAENGLQGLELFKELRPEIVMTDISMPGMDGISMASDIKAIASQTVIIAVTAHSETDNLLQAIEIGINHYLLKPLDYGRICDVIDQAIATVGNEQLLRSQYEEICSLNASLTARTRELEDLNCELEAFNYTVAHDLRSPMVSIGGFSQFLLERFEEQLDETGYECLQVIARETMRMNDLIEALLNFSSVTRKNVNKQWTDFSNIANEIKGSLMLRDPQRRVNFTIGDNIQGFADQVLIGVVIENLLGNAWKYTANKDTATIEFGVANVDEELVYFVRDNGPGFDQQEADRLFVPFQRLQSSAEFKGYGIGLATVNRIILRHGGRIWAEGVKDKGATFYFTL